MEETNDSIKMAVQESFWGLFIGDSLSMPVHWYYDVPCIKRDFNGWIKTYEAPKLNHPSSILHRSNTGNTGVNDGRPTRSAVIGNVILHDKLDAWNGKGKSNHYHQGMKAGDSTLNSHCALQVWKTLKKNQTEKNDTKMIKHILYDYVSFLTTPNTHNDAYAESFHRLFFADWLECGCSPSMDRNRLYEFVTARSERILNLSPDKQLEVVGSFVMMIPVVLRNIQRPENEVVKLAQDFVSLTHPVATLSDYIETYVKILYSVIHGSDLREECEKALKEMLGPAGSFMLKSMDSKLSKSMPGSEEELQIFQSTLSQIGIACYIEGALTSMLLIARYFHDDAIKGILMNTNVGGENCHRGAALGALLGAATGRRNEPFPSEWKEGLTLSPNISEVV